MTFIILDNGLRSSGDHSYAINRALKTQLNHRGIASKIYAFDGVDSKVQADLACVPHFSRQLYDSVGATNGQLFLRRIASALTFATWDSHPSERTNACLLNRSFYEDLTRLPTEIWAAGNIVLFPGIMQHQLLGLARFIKKHQSANTAKIVCQLMFEPSWLPWGALARRSAGLYRKSFRELRPQIDRTVFLTTENDHLARSYHARFRVKPGLLPVPLLGAVRDGAGEGAIQIGFFGYSKAEKGFHLLPEAIRLCLAVRADLRFNVQVQHHGTEPVTVAAETALRQIPNLRLFAGALSAAEFSAATAPIDVMLLPYDRALFGMRGSGLYIESISAGRLIVAAEGTWAAHGIAAGEAVGAVFTPYTSEALAGELLRLCRTMKELRSLARAKAAAHARANSIEAYVDAILTIIGQQVTGASFASSGGIS